MQARLQILHARQIPLQEGSPCVTSMCANYNPQASKSFPTSAHDIICLKPLINKYTCTCRPEAAEGAVMGTCMGGWL